MFFPRVAQRDDPGKKPVSCVREKKLGGKERSPLANTPYGMV
jgi:hypothetical protein